MYRKIDNQKSQTKFTDYKMTELGPLPQEWDVVRLGEVFSIQQGKQLSQKNRIGNNQKYFLRTANVFWGFIDTTELDSMHFTQEEEKKYKLETGDLLVCEGGDIGRTAIWEIPINNCYYQNHLHRLRAKNNNIYPRFYLYWLWYAFEISNIYFGHGNITTIPNLSSSRLSLLNIPLPPLAEQRKIAAILSTVQKAIEIEGKLIEHTKELKKAMMHKLFTEGIGWLSGSETSQKQTEIGPIPKNWEVVRLGDYLLTNNDFRFSIDKENIETVSFIPMSLIPEENLFISQFEKRKTHDIKSGIVVFENDLLIAKITPCFENGKQGIVKGLVNGWGYATTEVIPIRTNKQINLKYIAYYLKYPKIRNFLASKMEGSTGRQRLPKSQIENLKIPLPPLPEQQAIADILSTIDQKIEHHTTKKQKLEELFRTLLHELMTAKVRVNKINFEFLKMEDEI